MSNYSNYLASRKCCDLRGLGPQGPQGAQGIVGRLGPMGIQGSTGITGPQGVTGAQGVPGGATGATGAPGGIGFTGATGERGLQGFTGATGAPGEQGPPGGSTGATGSQGPIGPSSTYYLDYQIVPLLPTPPFSPNGSPLLYYSYAVTTNSCINFFQVNSCGKNSYSYTLYECSDDTITINCPAQIAKHDNLNICVVQSEEPRLRLCSSDGVNARYMCAITDGPLLPNEDAYIEWHWYAKYITNLIPQTVTGKFIFVASANYISKQKDSFGYRGAQDAGIGMFNPSNHNP